MSASPGVTELDRDRLVWMYTQMLRIREFEERVKRTFEDHPGVIRGHTHLADGAEASIVGSIATLGPDNVFGQIALFFSTMAVVTFGGAYAVLAYVAQQAVETYGWLAPGEPKRARKSSVDMPADLTHFGQRKQLSQAARIWPRNWATSWSRWVDC